jgi:hypothetical protein
MGDIYKFEINSIHDCFVRMLLEYDGDISKEGAVKEIKLILSTFLIKYINESELIYLDFDIQNYEFGYKVVANNFTTALVFNNIIPNSFSIINKQKVLHLNGIIYSFDELTKKIKKG